MEKWWGAGKKIDCWKESYSCVHQYWSMFRTREQHTFHHNVSDISLASPTSYIHIWGGWKAHPFSNMHCCKPGLISDQWSYSTYAVISSPLSPFPVSLHSPVCEGILSIHVNQCTSRHQGVKNQSPTLASLNIDGNYLKVPWLGTMCGVISRYKPFHTTPHLVASHGTFNKTCLLKVCGIGVGGGHGQLCQWPNMIPSGLHLNVCKWLSSAIHSLCVNHLHRA